MSATDILFVHGLVRTAGRKWDHYRFLALPQDASATKTGEQLQQQTNRRPASHEDKTAERGENGGNRHHQIRGTI